MEITNEQRDLAFETASEQQKFLYSSPESGRRLREIATKHRITSPEQYKEYALLVGDVVLNLITQSELPTQLSHRLNINSEQAVQITGDLIDFLNQKMTTAVTNKQPQTSPRVAPVEETYTSTQEALLKESRTAAKTPPPIPGPSDIQKPQ